MTKLWIILSNEKLNLKTKYAFTGYLESDIIWDILEQCKMSLKVLGTVILHSYLVRR